MPEAWHEEITKLYDLCAEYDVDITQIKIKYGGLRFYVGSAPDLVHNAIEKAEQICFDKKLIY